MAIIENITTLFPVEAKSLATEDDINLDQILGGAQTASVYFRNVHAHVVPLAVQMISNGLRVAIFKAHDSTQYPDSVDLEKAVQVTFNPPIFAWQ